MHALVLALCLTPSQSETLGKTDAEVLKMGRLAWSTFHEAKVGGSTAAMCEAEVIFGNVLKRRNDVALAAKSVQTRDHVRVIRRELPRYLEGVYEVGMALSGGGTLWNIVHSGTRADTEEVVGHLLGKPSPKVKARRVSNVTSALSDLRGRVAKERKSIEEMPSGGGVAGATAGLAKAESAWKRLVAVAAKRSRSDSDAILSACLSGIDDVKEFVGDGN